MYQQEARLNEAEVYDVVRLYFSHPVLDVGRNSFINMVLQCTPEVTIKSMPGTVSEELNMLLEFKYKEAAGALYDWTKMFGICPYKMIRVSPQSVHWYPLVPDMGTGYIATYVDKNYRQQFRYYPSQQSVMAQPQEDRKMQWWIVDRNRIPDIHGLLRSDVSTLLEQYRTEKILRESMEIGAWHGVRQMHVIEHHPAKSGSGADEHLTTLESFGEDVAGMVMHQEEMLQQKKMRIRTQELLGAVHDAHASHSSVTHTQMGASESEQSVRERQDSGLSKRVVSLPRDFVYKSTASPKLLGDLMAVSRRLDMNCAAVMDFPLEMIQSQSAARASNVQGNSRFWNERVKHWTGVFEAFYKHTLLLAYGQVIQNKLNARSNSLQRQMQLYAHNELTVEMPCSPMITWDTLKQLGDYQLMDKQHVGEHVFANYGLPMAHLHVREEAEEQQPLLKRHRRREMASTDDF